MKKTRQHFLVLASALLFFSFSQKGNDSESDRYLQMAIDKEHKGEERLAMEYLTKSLKFNPKNVKALIERGDLHLALEEFDDALSDYETALKLGPTEELYYKIAVVHSDEGEDREALHYINKALEYDFENYEYYYYKGLSHMRMGDNVKAITDFDKADDLHEGDHNVYYHRALVHLHMHHHKLALNDFTKAINLLAYPDYYHERGLCYYELEQYEEAIKDFDKAIEKGDDLDSYLSRGLAFDKLNRFKEAEDDYIFYLKHNPDNAAAQYQFGLIEYHAKKYSNAEDLFNKVIKAEPKNKMAFFYRGMVRFKMNKKDDACADFNTCKKLGYVSGYNQMKQHCK